MFAPPKLGADLFFSIVYVFLLIKNVYKIFESPDWRLFQLLNDVYLDKSEIVTLVTDTKC